MQGLKRVRAALRQAQGERHFVNSVRGELVEPQKEGSKRWPSDDDAAAEADFAVIEHNGLSGRARPLRAVDREFERVIVAPGDAAGRVGLAVAGLGGVGLGRIGGDAADPVELAGGERRALELRMLVALYHDEGVARHVLGGDEPGVGAAVLLSADAEPLALA